MTTAIGAAAAIIRLRCLLLLEVRGGHRFVLVARLVVRSWLILRDTRVRVKKVVMELNSLRVLATGWTNIIVLIL